MLAGELEPARRKFDEAIRVSGGRFALAHVNKGVLKLHESQDLSGAIDLCKKVRPAKRVVIRPTHSPLHRLSRLGR